MKRTALRRVGARANRERPELVAFRSALLTRSHGRCERCGFVATAHSRLDSHHVVNKARCVGWPLMNNPDMNGLALCRACHDRLTKYPLDEGGHLEGRIKRAFLAFEAWRVWDRPVRVF